MITSKDIFAKDGMLCIAVADPATGLRGFELSSQRPPALLYKDGSFTRVAWLGVRLENDRRCLCFDAKPFGEEVPASAFELAHSLRPNAFDHLENLAQALQSLEGAKDCELDWNFSALPLSSIYFLEDTVLLLPARASDFIDSVMPDEDRFLDREAWYVHNEANGFGKAHYLFQLLYYALASTMPFAPQDVRDCGFRPIPLSLFFSDDDGVVQKKEIGKLCNAVDRAFSMTRKDMYKVSSPYEYFLTALENIKGKVSANDFTVRKSKVYKEYLQKLAKKASIRRFLRKKGAVLAATIAGAAIVVSIAWYYIALALAPPATAGLPKEDIVRAYYKAINDLDLQGVKDSLARGSKSPDEMTVTNLEVTQKVRYAYEGTDPIVEAQSWLDEGMPAIPQGTMVYGIANLGVQTMDDATAIATFDFLRPYEDYSMETDATTASSVFTGVYHETVEFSFIQRKTWLEISSIDVLEETLTDVFEVSYKDTESSVSTMVLRTDPF